MNIKLIAIPLLTLAAACASDADAQQVNIKPGLWQLDMRLPGQQTGPAMAGYVEQMKAQMASMPPEQRKKIESALAQLEARGTEFTGDGLRTKQCITKQNLADFDFLGKKGMESCTKQATPRPGGMNVSMRCTRPQMKVDASMTYQGDKAYTFESTATVTGPDGKPTTHQTSGTGKWLGSDCGSIAPASANQ